MTLRQVAREFAATNNKKKGPKTRNPKLSRINPRFPFSAGFRELKQHHRTEIFSFASTRATSLNRTQDGNLVYLQILDRPANCPKPQNEYV